MATIPGSVRVGGFIAPSDTTDTYATHDSLYGMGGYREVGNATERDAIPAARRREGMAVYIIDPGATYQLVGGIANSNWAVMSTGGGGGVTDHGALTGLADDDHTQYHTDARGDARYSLTGHTHTGYAAALGADDNYVTDAEKTKLANLSGTNTGDQDLSGYSSTSHNHSLNNLTEKSYNSLTDKPSIPSISGLLNESAHDALDHTGLTGIPAAYTLPTASTTVLGGVKVDGSTVTISNGVISSTGGGTGMTNPMTAAGDIIIGGAAGAATRLAKGTDGQVLTLTSGAPAWAAASGGSGSSTIDWANPVSVTDTATLTISKHHIVTVTSADKTLTLPTVADNAGKLISIQIAVSTTKLITIDGNASETIDGVTTRIMWASETAILLCNGVTWTKISGKSIPMVGGLYPSAQTTVNNATTTLVQSNTVKFTPSVAQINDSANSRLLIPRTAPYLVQYNLQYYDNTATGRYYTELGTDGSGTIIAVNMLNMATTGQYPPIKGNFVAPLTAGSFLYLYAYQASGGTQIIHNDPGNTFLSIQEIPAW